MRRIHSTRRMTTAERWELGLFISMLIVGCLLLTAVMNQGRGALPPEMVAWSAASAPGKTPSGQGSLDVAAAAAIPSIEQLSVSHKDILPEARAVPLSAEKIAVVSAKPHISAKPLTPDVKVVDGQTFRYVKTLKLRVTAYAPDPRCTYPYSGTTTASGLSVKTNGGKLVAADTSVIPMHALVLVPGYAGGATVPVLDRGGAIKGNRLDVLMPTFEQAQQWGSRNLEVKVYLPVK